MHSKQKKILLFTYSYSVAACFVTDWSKLLVRSIVLALQAVVLLLQQSKNQILSFFPFHKQTNRILSRKKIAHFVAFDYIYIVVACFVTDWSKFISLKHLECVLALQTAIHTSMVLLETSDFVFFTGIYRHPKKNVVLLCCIYSIAIGCLAMIYGAFEV